MTVIQGQSGVGMLGSWGGNTDSSGRLIKRGCTVSDFFSDCPPAGENEPSYVVAHSDDSGQQVGAPNQARKGRPALHADGAARVRAHRAKLVRLDVTVKPEIGDTIKQISGVLDCSANELLNSLIRFALTNRNWKKVGLYGSKGLQ